MVGQGVRVWEWGVGKGQRHHLVEEHAERPDVGFEAVRFAVDDLSGQGKGAALVGKGSARVGEGRCDGGRKGSQRVRGGRGRIGGRKKGELAGGSAPLMS